jgi:hypothetical protein
MLAILFLILLLLPGVSALPADPAAEEEEDEPYSYTTHKHITTDTIKDTKLAQALIGTPILHYFPGKSDDPGTGEVVSYFTFDASDNELEGYVMFEIEFKNSDVDGIQDLTYKQVMQSYNNFTTFNDLPSPLQANLQLPPGTIPPMPTQMTTVPGQGPTAPYPLPIPTSFNNHVFVYSANNETHRAKVTNRAVSTTGTHLWLLQHLSPTTSHPDLWIDTEHLHNIMSQSKIRSKQNPPNKVIPHMNPTNNYYPSADEGWTFIPAGIVGSRALVHLPPNSTPSASPVRRKNTHRTPHLAIIEATLPGPTPAQHQFWGRIVTQPSISILFTSAQEAVDAVQSYEQASRTKSKSKFFTHHDVPPITQPPATLNACTGDFTQPLSNPSWLSSLDSLLALTDSVSYHTLKSGVCICKKKISKPNSSTIRRLFASLIASKNHHHPIIPLLIEVFWALILAPPDPTSPYDFNHCVKIRCKLFSDGNWKQLWDGLVFHNSTHQHQPQQPSTLEDPLDAKAQRMQHQLTRFGSVRGASKTLKSPPPTQTSTNLLTTFQALHPQVGDPLPPPQTPPSITFEDLTPLSSFEAIHSNHRRPIFDPNQPLPTNNSTNIQFTTEDYIKKVRRCDETSAGGLNGMNYSILKLIFKYNDHLAQTYSTYLNQILNNDVSTIEREFLNASRGVGVPKNEQGDMRPIAVGHLLLRLLGSMAVQSIATKAQQFFMPLQFGVGVKNGCELMSSAISAHLRLHPEHSVISCDTKNAFNSFDRSQIWKPLRTHFPEIEKLVQLAYAGEGSVIFNNDGAPTEVKSTIGARQGCAMGSFLYCLASHTQLSNLQQSITGAQVFAYCDDTHIVGPPEVASRAYNRWSHTSSTILQTTLRDDKGAIFSTQHSHQHHIDLGCPSSMSYSSQGTKVLGSPIGSHQFIHSFMEEKVSILEKDVDLVGRMSNNQAQLAFTVKSLQHRFNYYFRNVPLGDRSDFLTLAARYDAAILSVVQRILHNKTLSVRATKICHLPANLGGLGLRSWFNSADPAYLASHLYSATILPNHFPYLKEAFIQPTTAPSTNPLHHQPMGQPNSIFIINSNPVSTPSTATGATQACLRLDANNDNQASSRVCNGNSLHNIQASLSSNCDRNRQSSLFNSIRNDPDEYRRFQFLARLISGMGDPHTFDTVPTDNMTSFNNSQFRVALCQKLLEPLIQTTSIKNNMIQRATFYCPNCNKHSQPISSTSEAGSSSDIDPYGYHAYKCSGHGHSVRTKNHHDALTKIWAAASRSTGALVRIEPRGEMADGNKRADFMTTDEETMRNHFFDIRTCDPLLSHCVSRCSLHPGYAADLGVASKNRDWLEITHTQGDQFLAICHEQPGRIGEGALAYLGQLAARFSSTTSQRNAFRTFWLQRLHITNSRGSSDVILSRMPFSDISDDSSHSPHFPPYHSVHQIQCLQPSPPFEHSTFYEYSP